MRVQANFKLGKIPVEINKKPDHCPICLRAIDPVDATSPWMRPDERLEIVFRCPKQECECHFVARYRPRPNTKTQTPLFDFSEAVPASENSENIQKISPDFIKVYREAEEAELRNLKLVCGPGYRKALEFLIKDYIIRLKPEEAEKIKNLPLSNCISVFVQNDKVKEVAKRAAWLGNDETHYLRKWEDRDVKDLKNLIKLTVYWIEMERLTEETIKGMPQGK
jgi:hypothetical protein